jgi:biotin carboxylase
MFSTSRCAVVDAHATGRFLPDALRAHGVDWVHVVSPHPIDRLAVAHPDAAEIRHDGDVARTAGRLRELGVDSVVAGCESGVELADELSAALGTPGNGMSRPRCRRDKAEMVVALREAGLAHVATFASDSAAEVVAWSLDQGTWPIVLKPLSSAGTDNVHFCDSVEEIRSAHRRIMAAGDLFGLPNTAVLAQRFLAGDEYFVNTVSRAGRHHVVEVWRYHKRSVGSGRRVYDYEHPVPADDPAARRVADYTLRVLDALEVRNGSSHTEVMLTADGPVLVESAARPGGSHLPEVVSMCLAANQVELLALSIARPGEFLRMVGAPYQLRRHLRYVSLINPRDGVVPSWERLAAVRALPSYAEMLLTAPAGLTMPPTVDLLSSPGYVYLISDDPRRIEADYQELRRLERAGLYDGPVVEAGPGRV